MTTVVARAGILAGDGLETDEEMVVSRTCQKVFRLPDGRLVGFSGSSEQGHVLYDTMCLSLDIPKLDNCTGLMIDMNGAIWLYEGMVWRRYKVPFYAIGSGSYFAMAAMKAGADAVKACRIGADMDPNSGGRVRWLNIERVVKAAGGRPTPPSVAKGT